MHSAIPYALDQHSEQFIAGQVATGRFQTASEVVQAGLHMLETYEMQLQNLRRLIDEADDAVAAGHVTHYRTREELRAAILKEAELEAMPLQKGE